MKNFEYLEPTTVAEACALLKQHAGEAKVFAGGTHLTILMKQGLFEPKALVNIKKIPELKGVRYDSDRRFDHRRADDAPRARNVGTGAREVSGSLRSRKRSRQYSRAQHGHGRRQSRFRRTADGFVADIHCARRQSENRRTKRQRARLPSKNCSSTFIRQAWLKMKSSRRWCCRRAGHARVSSTFAFPAARWSTSRRLAWRCG